MSADSSDYREDWLPVKPGLNLYFRDYARHAGAGAIPVICLHGYWRTSRDFEELAHHLTASRRVVTPDLRGRGRSGRSLDVADYRFERLAEDVLSLLSRLAIERAVFVGTALGAQLAMELAANRPSLVAGLVFNDSAPESNPAAGARMKKFSGGGALSFQGALDRVRAQYEPDFPRLGRDDWARLVRRGYREDESGKFVRDFDQLTNEELVRIKRERPTFWSEFERIGDIPIAVLRGANSDYLTPEITQRMLQRRPQTKVHIIPDCGHPVMLWEPEAFAAIDQLLAEADRSA